MGVLRVDFFSFNFAYLWGLILCFHCFKSVFGRGSSCS